MDFSQFQGKSEAELERMKYDKILNSYLKMVDAYADLSLRVKDGEITAEQLVDEYDELIRPVAQMLLLLDALRGPGSLIRRAEREAESRDQSIDEQVAAFRGMLDGL